MVLAGHTAGKTDIHEVNWRRNRWYPKLVSGVARLSDFYFKRNRNRTSGIAGKLNSTGYAEKATHCSKRRRTTRQRGLQSALT